MTEMMLCCDRDVAEIALWYGRDAAEIALCCDRDVADM